MTTTTRTDRRSPEAQAYRRLYNASRWKHPTRGVRAQQLKRQPLCEMCLKAGRLTPATICDHVDPRTKDDPETFFTGPYQSLCSHHHDSKKQQQEVKGYSTEVGADGLPTDPNHPWNRG